MVSVDSTPRSLRQTWDRVACLDPRQWSCSSRQQRRCGEWIRPQPVGKLGGREANTGQTGAPLPIVS